MTQSILSSSDAAKRRVLYIRHRRPRELSDAFRMNQDEWLETMSMLADVTLMQDDFDMNEICDRIRPDFILYESPYFFPTPLTIKNPKAYPHILRLAFMMQDPYCTTRVNFLRMMEQLGIEWMFTHMTETALRQSPELAARTFSVPLLFDDRLYRDYGLPKDIPVSVFGGFLQPEMYNWRAEVTREIPEHFPTLIYTHPGYHKPIPRHKFAVSGEDYARLVNRSHFSLADSTRFDCLVRKHLEIPACGTVLVAPDAPVMKPYGFKDMENCILGSGHELFEKIATVAEDPALYERIRKNGYDLVHTRYTRKHWRSVLDFFECWRRLKPGETIRQQGILGPFVGVPAQDAPQKMIIADLPDSGFSGPINEWHQSLFNGDALDVVEGKLAKMKDWLHFFEEQWVPFGIMSLLKGDPVTAQKHFLSAQELRVGGSGFTDYDPEEIAWLSLAASLTGDAKALEIVRSQSAAMRHLDLRRVAWLGQVLASRADISKPPANVVCRLPDDRMSIYLTGQLPLEQWLSLIRRIFNANGQGGLLSYSGL